MFNHDFFYQSTNIYWPLGKFMVVWGFKEVQARPPRDWHGIERWVCTERWAPGRGNPVGFHGRLMQREDSRQELGVWAGPWSLELQVRRGERLKAFQNGLWHGSIQDLWRNVPPEDYMPMLITLIYTELLYLAFRGPQQSMRWWWPCFPGEAVNWFANLTAHCLSTSWGL